MKGFFGLSVFQQLSFQKGWIGHMKLSKLLSSLGISSGFQEAEVSDIVYDSRKGKAGLSLCLPAGFCF